MLEDRAVPSSGGLSLRKAGCPRSAPRSKRLCPARHLGPPVRAETLLPSPGASAPTGNVSSVSIAVATEAAALGASIASAVQGVVSGNAASLLQQQRSSASPGSLVAGRAGPLAASAGSATRLGRHRRCRSCSRRSTVALAASYNATAVEISLDVTVHSSNGSPLNPARYGNQINPGYANPRHVRPQAETGSVSPGGPTSP